jgi:hypothetical protein
MTQRAKVMETAQPNNQARERSPKTDRPYLWVYIYAPQMIRERIGGDRQTVNCIAVYTILALMAARERSQKFSAPISVIASHAGLRYRTTHESLWLLSGANMIGIQENRIPGKKANLPHTFTLLSLKRARPDGVVPVELKGLITGSESSLAGSIKDYSSKELYNKKESNAPADASSALPHGSGDATSAKGENNANASTQQFRVGGTW